MTKQHNRRGHFDLTLGRWIYPDDDPKADTKQRSYPDETAEQARKRWDEYEAYRRRQGR